VTTERPGRRLAGMNRHAVSVDGHNVNVFEGGSGAVTVMLVPGIPDSSAVYGGQAQGLLEAGYRVIAPDLLGLGDSDMPDGIENYTIARDQQRLWAVADTLDARTFTWWDTTGARPRRGSWPPSARTGSRRTSRCLSAIPAPVAAPDMSRSSCGGTCNAPDAQSIRRHSVHDSFHDTGGHAWRRSHLK
jgi:hypothetical protein